MTKDRVDLSCKPCLFTIASCGDGEKITMLDAAQGAFDALCYTRSALIFHTHKI